MVTVFKVEQGSPAEKAGIREGDHLLSIDSHPIGDVLDYRFFITEESILLTFLRNNSTFDVRIKKERYSDIGLEFETFLMDKKRHCANRCIFCFIDQNPCGMRETVYFKDDDTRLSFLMGNYVTLTNVKDEELQRIVSMRLSPVNVSVHTTNGSLRVKMLGNPKADRILDQLQILKDGGIDINCQIVLCRGINDGPELARTLRDLEQFFPAVQSIAVVPAGLTRHREGLYPLNSYDRESALQVLSTVERFAAEFMEKYDLRMVYAADEFYLTAKKDLPSEAQYDAYPQLDNGVGLIRSAREELLDEISYRVKEGKWARLPKKPLSVTLLTGFAAERFLKEISNVIMGHLPQLNLTVKAVENRFFGNTVTVAGLLCGQDLMAAVQDIRADAVFLPAVSLRHERDLFLDGLSPKQVEEAAGCPVFAVENGIPLLDQIEALLNGR